MKGTKRLTPKARTKGLVVHPLAHELLVYDLERHKAHCLNKSAAMVWERCDGKTGVAELAQYLGDELKAPVEDEMVWLALDQLERIGLLQEEMPAAQKLGLSRRALIKRIGVGGAMALPLITSIVAPKAAQAATVCGSVNCAAGNVCPTGCTCIAIGSPCV
jgi:hypothetical protein